MRRGTNLFGTDVYHERSSAFVSFSTSVLVVFALSLFGVPPGHVQSVSFQIGAGLVEFVMGIEGKMMRLARVTKGTARVALVVRAVLLRILAEALIGVLASCV